MVRGGMIRGRPMRGGGIRPPPFKKTFIPRHPFDLTLVGCFPKVASIPDDAALTAALLKRNQDLSPTPAEQTSIANLVTKVQGVLDNLVVAPGDFNTCQLEEVRQVGSFKKGTMLTGSNTADIVVILKTLPTKEACDALAKKVEVDLKNAMKTEVLTKADQITTTIHDRGFDISNWQAKVCILIATLPQNLRKLEADIHLDQKIMQAHLAAIRHTRWFEENAHHSSIKVLIRILKDLKRFEAFEALSPWMLDLIAHLAIMNNPSRQAMPINLAFRRVFQLLSAGLFLPGSAGITDPCEPGHIRVHTAMTLEQQDVCCLTAQTLLRVLAHGGYKQILGMENNSSNIIKEMSVWSGVVVSPLEPVYEKPTDKKDGDETEEDMEAVENDGVEEEEPAE